MTTTKLITANPITAKLPSFTPPGSGLLQRKCSCGGSTKGTGECEECRRKRMKQLQRREVGSKPESVPTLVHDVLRSSGYPLDRSTQTFMERRLGHDFGHVRVHRDDLAAESAQRVNAEAYAVGRHAVFGRGKYNPNSVKGMRLIAHELVHTLQQADDGTSVANGLQVAPSDDPAEREAERIATDVLASSEGGDFRPDAPKLRTSSNAVHHPAAASVQRQPENEKKPPPLIPIPVFDELDPMIIVPDIEGIPELLRGQQIKLSTLRSALDVLRGRLPRLSPDSESDICATLLPGHEQARSGDVAGMCCPRFVRDPDRCCIPQQIAALDFRCCRGDEVVVSGRCIMPQIVPPAPLPTPQRPPTFPEIPPLTLGLPPMRFGSIQSLTIDHFVLDGAALPAAAAKPLDQLASMIRFHAGAEVHIEGHTDSSADPEHNQPLSQRRAKTVRDALIARGVDATRIVEVIGHGEESLRFPEERNNEERAGNRRVEVWVYTPPTESLSDRFRLRMPSLLTPP